MQKKRSTQKTSGQLTRNWLRSLNYRVECVESLRWGGGKKDFLDFIDDIAWFDRYMIGIQSCFDFDLSIHKKKFAELVKENGPIVDWMRCHELWLVWWTKSDDNVHWYPNVSILNPSLEIQPSPAPTLVLIK